MNQNRETWTEARVELLTLMHERGPKAIWEALNELSGPKLTKSAVIGKRDRMFGVRKPTKTEGEKAAARRATREKDAALKRAKRVANRLGLGVGAQMQAINRRMPAGSFAAGVVYRVKAKLNGYEAPSVPLHIAHDADDVQPRHISLLELTDETCRWPYGDQAPFTFCGCTPITGGPYCFSHDERSKPPAVQRKAGALGWAA